MTRILVIDDDRELCLLLTEYLEPKGFSVDVAYDGETGAVKLREGKYDIAVLDIMLPGGRNGFDVLRSVRDSVDTPIVMLSARGEDVDRIVGLEMGADDYLPKPFNPRELLARVHAVLRRSQTSLADSRKGSATRYRYGDVELDLDLRKVWKANIPVRLTNVEFHILEMLMRNCGTAVSRDTMSEEVLDRPLMPFDRSIDVHVSKLRKKLGDDHGGAECIRAIRGTGYMFVDFKPDGTISEVDPEIPERGRDVTTKA